MAFKKVIFADTNKSMTKLSPEMRNFKEIVASDIKINENQHMFINMQFLKKIMDEDIKTFDELVAALGLDGVR